MPILAKDRTVGEERQRKLSPSLPPPTHEWVALVVVVIDELLSSSAAVPRRRKVGEDRCGGGGGGRWRGRGGQGGGGSVDGGSESNGESELPKSQPLATTRWLEMADPHCVAVHTVRSRSVVSEIHSKWKALLEKAKMGVASWKSAHETSCPNTPSTNRSNPLPQGLNWAEDSSVTGRASETSAGAMDPSACITEARHERSTPRCEARGSQREESMEVARCERTTVVSCAGEGGLVVMPWETGGRGGNGPKHVHQQLCLSAATARYFDPFDKLGGAQTDRIFPATLPLTTATK
ncbi:hypothetical protein DFJ73DRAFT_768892 [Zopfochytrium polystomum]|nr:hypothetical protein DFJ73DRAFT_768892 [Zopfochytrium polystomum]